MALTIKGKFAIGAAWPGGSQLTAWQQAIGETRQPATVETGATLIVGKTTVEFFTTDLKKLDLKPLLSAKKLKPRSHWYKAPAKGVAATHAPWVTPTIECFTEGCATTLAATPGNYYCPACIAEQTTAHAAELAAFDEYHEFADAIAA